MRRFIRDENGVHFDRPSLSYDQKEFVPLEVKSGSFVVIHGDLVHQRYAFWLHIDEWYFNFILLIFGYCSFENLSPNSRHALSLHVVDTDGFVWAKDNWLVYKELIFSNSPITLNLDFSTVIYVKHRSHINHKTWVILLFRPLLTCLIWFMIVQVHMQDSRKIF